MARCSTRRRPRSGLHPTAWGPRAWSEARRPFSHQLKGATQRNQGRAGTIDYDAGKSLLRLDGGAWYSDGRNEITSPFLVYNLADRSLEKEAREGERVILTIRPGTSTTPLPALSLARAQPAAFAAASTWYQDERIDAARHEPAQELSRPLCGRRTFRWKCSPGEIVGLLGPNGAGKTTAFYMIVGLISADTGTVELDGQDLTSLPMHRRAQLGVGYLPQEASVFRRLSVDENILSILETRADLDAAGRASRLEEILADLRIGHVRENRGMALSGGERRRVEIARALAAAPRFILLDEPFAGRRPPVGGGYPADHPGTVRTRHRGADYRPQRA